MRSRKPLRLDPVKLLKHKKESNKERNKEEEMNKEEIKTNEQKKKSRKTSRNNSRSSRNKSRSSRNKSRSKKTSRKNSRNKSRKQSEQIYAPVKLQSPRRQLSSVEKSGSRISSNRVLYQRLSPYYEKTGKELTILPEDKHIQQLQKLSQQTRDQPMLNQIIKENILTRA